ncbi:MAG: glycoside hydrolase family 38 C-terminal domain-containing protein [Cyclobacteriaceae bacterium]
MNNSFSFKKLIFLLFLFPGTHCFSQKTESQWPVKIPNFFQGFEIKISGEELDFLPGLTNGQVALLARASDGSSSLEFKTSVIPTSYSESFVSFVWSAAIGKKLQDQPGTFDLYINNKKSFTFYAHSESLSASWKLQEGESDLSFVSTEITKDTQDAFGYMFLNLPTASITKGERVTIKVVGRNQKSMDWYMPFGVPVTNAQDVLAEPALVKTENGLKQRIRVEIKHAGAPTPIQFKLDNEIVKTGTLKPGKRIYYLMSNPVSSTQQVELAVTIGKSKTNHKVTLNPVRKFEVYFLPHSHVDIGFTHRQDEVEKLQWRNFELGIELAEKTKDYPDGAQFKWNAEITWAIDGYLKNATEEKKQQFINAIEKGWIGLDALYGSQLTGLQREEELINNQRFAGELAEQYGFDISTAMISDVPGYSWGTVESLAQTGVKYFSSGPNHMPHLPHGGYQVGHTFEAWGDVPFYWSSASGKQKVLFWMTSHGYSWFHSWSVDILSKAGGDPILRHLDELEKQGYPYDLVQLRYTIGNDNGPPDVTMPDFIKNWNETYAYPKMRIATNREMMEALEKRYGDQLPVHKGDFTPYWEDGAASSALETGINRKTADQLIQAETLWSMLDRSTDNKPRFDEAWKNVVLFSEHTWGAAGSKSEPDSEFTKDLWRVKQSFALDAEKESQQLVEDALQTVASPEDLIEAFQVINTTSWDRTDLVTLPASWNLRYDKIEDETGKAVETQRLRDGSLAFVAHNVPALGATKYYTKKGKVKSQPESSITAHSISNDQLSVVLDPENGNITSLTSGSSRNRIDEKDSLGFNAYWYGGLIKENMKHQGEASFEVIEKGPVVNTIRVISPAPAAEGLTRDIQVVNGLDRVYLTNVVDKKRVTDNENVRFTFPFNIPNSQVRIDIPWGTMKPEEDQLNGANKNFYSVQRWVDVSNENMGVTLATVEAPLLEIGDMNGQKWMADMTVRPWIKKYEPSNRIISWVMNNAWFVNYKAYQDGKIPFHYVLRPHHGFNDFETKKFGIEQTQPLIAVPVSKDADTITPLLQLQDGANVLITSLKQSRDGKAVMIRFFNPTDDPGKATLAWKALTPPSMYTSSPREEQGTVANNFITLDPWEVKTIRVELK